MEQQILASAIQISSCTALLLALLLWLQRGNNRSRIFFAIAYGVCGIDLFLRIYSIYSIYSGEPLSMKALHPGYIYMSLLEVPLFLFYIIEVVNPGWLNWKKIGLIGLPWLVWNILQFILGIHFRELYSYTDIYMHIVEFNVWIRALFMLTILFFSAMIYYFPYNWRRSSADLYFIRIYGIGIFILALFFALSALSGSMLISILHLTYGTAFCFYIAYYELFIRLQVPKEGVGTRDDCVPEIASIDILCTTPNEADEECQSDEGQEVTERASELQWNKFKRKMEEMQPWRNPDMSITALADLLQTNRTTLSHLFQEQGYKGGYKEFINRRRIADFLELMDKHPQMNMQDAFFEVGYRSRMTALRNFKEYMGMGPSEYLNRLTKKE